MVIYFECERETKKLLDSFLDSGDYNGYGEIIAAAVRNLQLIQSVVARNGSLVLESDFQMPSEVIKPRGTRTQNALEIAEGWEPEVLARTASQAKEFDSIPEMFRRSLEQSQRPQFMPLPDDRWISGQHVPVNRWIFAMYNRLLPAKANCRAFGHLVGNGGKGIELHMVVSEISSEAVKLGDWLAFWDKRLGLNRDTAIATAFPLSTKNVEKSMSRYSNQFVANIDRYGRLSGLLYSLKLINYKKGKSETHLFLTEPGWEFACLENPILDSNHPVAGRKFADEEIDYLLNHICSNVPVEDSAYRTIIGLVLGGADTPDRIDEKLRLDVSAKIKEELTESFLISQRSGAISRMSDLNLIERIRNGVSITYKVTERGREYLTKKVCGGKPEDKTDE